MAGALFKDFTVPALCLRRFAALMQREGGAKRFGNFEFDVNPVYRGGFGHKLDP
jgi:hypothetical protein